jgi:hypothetical protein
MTERASSEKAQEYAGSEQYIIRALALDLLDARRERDEARAVALRSCEQRDAVRKALRELLDSLGFSQEYEGFTALPEDVAAARAAEEER